ncbi:MAG: hypothetical protein QNJ48_08685 [Desulfobacterales bacterium]|nr:hypothetical protein [Desulfobacterales bacterium]
MQLLDATLAFALTLAALATVATTILEAVLRIARMRKKNLIEVMKLLNNELGKSSLRLSPDERWRFFSQVIANPVVVAKSSLRIDWKESEEENEKILASFLSSFGKHQDRKGTYEKVSLEYVLRCLAESDSVKRAAIEAGDKLKTELNRIARKYEELGSAVSAGYKQNAQKWSIVIGILLALAANVDGLRIFEAYWKNPKLAAAIIEKHEDFMTKDQEVQDSMNALEALYFDESQKRAEIEAAKNDPTRVSEIAALEKRLQEIQKEITATSKMAAIKNTIQDAQNQVSDLRTLGVPIGWDYYPNCPYGKAAIEWLNSSPECRDIPETKRGLKWDLIGSCPINTIWNDFYGFLVWLLKVIITGMLIGLGAPFWFDVAKRLSRIRRGLKNPNASSEDRLAARDANGDADERKKIVADVVADTIAEANSEKAS